MPLRSIPDFNEKHWTELMKDLKKGNTKKQSDSLRWAIKNANNLYVTIECAICGKPFTSKMGDNLFNCIPCTKKIIKRYEEMK